VHFAGAKLEGDLVKGDDTREPLGHLPDLEDRGFLLVHL
jgi:hypothetical protein